MKHVRASAGLLVTIALQGCVIVHATTSMPEIHAHIEVHSVPGSVSSVEAPHTPGSRVDEMLIHATLDRYGTWHDDAYYGNVWKPSLEASGENFVPYGTQGRWALTDAGWYWQSTLTWGWLVFHYGRWVRREGEWSWVPGSQFAPAWVDWRVSEGWIGWAPLAPRGAPYSSPYAFARVEAFTLTGVWSHVVYGTPAISLYNGSRALRVDLGVGGAAYSWGPATQVFLRETLSPPMLSLAQAWSDEIQSRQEPVGPVPANPLPARGWDTLEDWTVATADDPVNSAARPGETVLIRSSVAHARLRETISIGSTPWSTPVESREPRPASVNNTVITNVVNNNVVNNVVVNHGWSGGLAVPAYTAPALVRVPVVNATPVSVGVSTPVWSAPSRPVGTPAANLRSFLAQ